MSAPCCVVVGTGRTVGGFVAPLLRAAGWDVVLLGRDRHVVDTINNAGGIWLQLELDAPRWVHGVQALTLDDPAVPAAVARADLLATSVGPDALTAVGGWLAPRLRARLTSGRPVNIVTFENHRRGPELLAAGLLEDDASLAHEIGRGVGIGGAAVWRAIATREVTPHGVRFVADAADECFVDALSLLGDVAPNDGSVPGLSMVPSFDDRMVEKLWLFNAGHAAAAYLGWRAGCRTLGQAMEHPAIRQLVAAVVDEAQLALAAHLRSRPASAPIAARSTDGILARYANPALADSVARVGREPRRKLAPHDRFVSPAIACWAAGRRPVALAAAMAAALAYAEPDDAQAAVLQRELQILAPEEVLATTSMLDPNEELARLVGDRYRDLRTAEVHP